jgi:hypothetical protein
MRADCGAGVEEAVVVTGREALRTAPVRQISKTETDLATTLDEGLGPTSPVLRVGIFYPVRGEASNDDGSKASKVPMTIPSWSSSTEPYSRASKVIRREYLHDIWVG